MEINTLGNGAMPVTANNKPPAGEVNAAAVENSSEATVAVDVGKDVEVVVNTLLRGQLDEMLQVLKQRESLLASLPPELREAVQQALQQGGTTPEQLPDGVAAWLQNGKKAADQLVQLAQLLEQAVVLRQPGQELTQVALQRLLAQVKSAGQGGTAEVLAQLQQLIKASGEEQQWQTGLERVLVPQHLADTLPELPLDLAKMLTKVFNQLKPQLAQLWQQDRGTTGTPVLQGQTEGPAPANAANPEQATASAKQAAATGSTWTAPKLVLLQQAAQALPLLKVPSAELQKAAQLVRQMAAALGSSGDNGKDVKAESGGLPALGKLPMPQVVGEWYAAAREKLPPVLQAALPSAAVVGSMPPSTLAEQLRQTADQFLFAACWQQQDGDGSTAVLLEKLINKMVALVLPSRLPLNQNVEQQLPQPSEMLKMQGAAAFKESVQPLHQPNGFLPELLGTQRTDAFKEVMQTLFRSTSLQSEKGQQALSGQEQLNIAKSMADHLPEMPPEVSKMLTKVFEQYKTQLTQLGQAGGGTAGAPAMSGKADGPAPALLSASSGPTAMVDTVNPEQAAAGAKQAAATSSAWTAPRLVLLQQAAQALPLLNVPPEELQAAAQFVRQTAAVLSGGTENGKVVTVQPGALPPTVTVPMPQSVGETYTAAREKLPPVLQALLPSVAAMGGIPPSTLAEQLRQTADQFLFAAYWQQQDRSGGAAVKLQKLAEQISAQPQPGLQALPQETTALLQRLLQGQTANQQLGNLVRQLAATLQQGIDRLPPEQRQAVEQLVNNQMLKLPPQVAETAVRQQLPELPKVWAAMRSLAAQPLMAVPENLKPQTLEAVKELAQTLYKPAALQTEKLPDHSTVAFSIPLYVAEGQYYPAHIHLYYQPQQQGSGGAARQNRYETWLRISLETKHVGTVDTVFRVYDEDKVDVRVGFSDSEAMQEFGQGVAELRKDLSDNRLQLQDISLHRVRT